MTMDVNLNGALALAKLTIPSMVGAGRRVLRLSIHRPLRWSQPVRFGYSGEAGLNAVTRFIAAKYGRTEYGQRHSALCGRRRG